MSENRRRGRPAAGSGTALPARKVIDHNEQFIRMLIHLALDGERISGAFEEGGTMTTADENPDPRHAPLPDDGPGTLPLSAPVDTGVAGPVDAVDTQVSAPRMGLPVLRGSGPETDYPPKPSTPPAIPEGDAGEWPATGSEPKAVTSPKAGPQRGKPAWWDRLYRDQDADLDTHTANTGYLLTVPADGGPVLIHVRKADEPAADERNDGTGEESDTDPRLPDVAQPTLQTWPQPVPRRRPSRFWRVLTFNGSAAGLGGFLGLNAYLSQFPPAAVTAAGGLLGAGAALGAGYAAWKVAGSELLADFVPFGALGRLGAVFVSAEVGRRLGQALLPYTSGAIARHTGLTQTDISLVVVGLALCGASGHLVWRTRHRGLLTRWWARVPLATSLLVCGLYSTGPVF
ncbi:hypothetical protein ACFWGI_06445 [Streptomyces niveus]|uniref:hypothetical protein n=1 Tax=Streptomyces niveus TaxID=193462 RepID=UPI0036552C1C